MFARIRGINFTPLDVNFWGHIAVNRKNIEPLKDMP